MKIETCGIDGLLIIQPDIFTDQRGYFFESYNEKKFKDQSQLQTRFVQDNESFSTYGTIRGLHYQKPPFAQTKLVRVISGRVLDVVVDIRSSSPTYGDHFSIELSSDNKTQLFVPIGFAHGYAVLSDHALFSYKVDNYYNGDSEDGILWNDAQFNIDWKINPDDVLLSNKDKTQPSFMEYRKHTIFN